jgi:hypothetical protein
MDSALRSGQFEVKEVGERFAKAATAEHAGALSSALPSLAGSIKLGVAAVGSLPDRFPDIPIQRYFMAPTSGDVVPL